MKIQKGRVYEIEPGGRAYEILNDDEIIYLKDLQSGKVVQRFRGQLKTDHIREKRRGE
ncbi:hypothetical protein SEA_MOAB_133 [Streptomyces phage Moab]|nr:hypothetical protein SEA_MOAB_133 [Streptomyces phage Moab]WMI33750.1 hypothetical protein SEA_PATELGO_136 [Streptomyces phage Patelgo]